MAADGVDRLAGAMSHANPAEILVVEDEASVRQLMARTLARYGLAPLEADNASQGLALFRTHRESVVLAIIDMVMPGMSGLDLAAQLQRERPGLRILYISGYVESVAMSVIGHQSPQSVLLKPFTPEDLIGRVRHLIAPAVPSR
jgi:DNA-binding response OmpR family regulator